jgi:hypothetical protein
MNRLPLRPGRRQLILLKPSGQADDQLLRKPFVLRE